MNSTPSRSGFSPEIETVARRAYAEYVGKLFKDKGSLTDNLLHAAIGMCGERSELVEAFMIVFQKDVEADIPQVRLDETVQEELGDLGFYIMAAALQLGIPESELMETDVTTEFVDSEGMVSLDVYTGQFLDYCKKAWAYEQEPNVVKLKEALFQIWQAFRRATLYLDLHHEYLRMVNVEKLSKRYPLGEYSDKHAGLRLDKVEEKSDAVNAFRARVLSALSSYDAQADKPVTELVERARENLRVWLNGDYDFEYDEEDSLEDLEILNAWGAI